MNIDSHFHTNVYEQYEGLLEKALSILSKEKIIVLSQSVDPESYSNTLKIAKNSPYVFPFFGIHPQVASEFTARLESLESFFIDAIAFGEIGLDHMYVKDTTQYPEQQKLLEHFFEWAQKDNKLVNLHLDGAEEEGLALLQNFNLRKVIVHGYKGPLKTMNELLDFGCYFSVGGNMIMDKFQNIISKDDWILYHEIIKAIPNERLLVESDGPCRMEPNPPLGAYRSLPSYIFEVQNKIARIKSFSTSELKTLVNNNFSRLISHDKYLQSYTKL